MPTSLVSTGVQFPDNSIQTTAAGASGVVLLQTVSTTSASTVDLTFSGSYSNYEVIYSDFYSATNQGIQLQMVWSSDNFSTTTSWDAIAGLAGVQGSYSGFVRWEPTGGTASFCYPSSTYGNAPGLTGFLMFPNAKSTTLPKRFYGTYGGNQRYSSQTAATSATSNGFMNSNVLAMTGVRFYATSQNIRGVFKLYGYV
jgi:hypothetical protein